MIFFLIATTSFLFRTLTNKEYTKNYSSMPSNMLFNAIGLSVTCVISIFLGGIGRPSPLLLLIASIFGLVFAGTVMLILVSFAKGPMGLVTLIFNLCCAVPAVTGVVIFKEGMNWMKGIGLALFLGVVLLSWRDGEAKGQQGKKEYVPAKVWMPVTILTMLMNGSLSMMQNMAVQWCPTESINVFNFWAYLIGGSALWIGVIVSKIGKKDFSEVKAKPVNFYVLALVCGILASAGNILIMHALKTMPSSIVYPLQCSLLTVATYLISLFYYKEARTKLGIPMVLLGLVSIVFLTVA